MSGVILQATELPHATSIERSRELVASDAAHLLTALTLEPGGRYAFDAQLPEIVGYVHPSQRPFFINLPDSVASSARNHIEWDAWPEELSSVKDVIDNDVANLGDPDRFAKVIPQLHKHPYHLGPHLDNGIMKPEQTADVFYTFATKLPAIFYATRILVKHCFDVRLTDDCITPKTPYVTAPEFAIVRLTHATPHASNPANERGTTKPFGRVLFHTEGRNSPADGHIYGH